MAAVTHAVRILVHVGLTVPGRAGEHLIPARLVREDMGGRPIDLQSWKRRQHFEFFRDYHYPYFNLCTELDVTGLHRRCRFDGTSFFLATLFVTLHAANEFPELRTRLRGDEVWLHDEVNAGSTVLREDDTFGFGYFPFARDFDAFHRAGRQEVERVRREEVELAEDRKRDDLLHFSVLPWIHFTSFVNARPGNDDDSVPKIVYGKYHAVGERWRMSVSLELHHAVADGIHAGRFLERVQALMNAPPF